jgi:hypothetical protein
MKRVADPERTSGDRPLGPAYRLPGLVRMSS